MRIAWLALLVLSGMTAGAETVIHRCTQDDGSVAFQETPCVEPVDDPVSQSKPEEPSSADDSPEFVSSLDETGEMPANSELTLPATLSQDRTECEKTSRGAIDAIEIEMLKGYTKEEGQRYLAELLVHTQQLRACKQL